MSKQVEVELLQQPAYEGKQVPVVAYLMERS